MTCKPTYVGKFVNVYLVDRAYGGPEEGGWWYDTGEAIRSTQVVNSTTCCLLAKEKSWCEEENAQRRSDLNSVLCEGRYEVRVEDEPAKDYPEISPHYE